MEHSPVHNNNMACECVCVCGVCTRGPELQLANNISLLIKNDREKTESQTALETKKYATRFLFSDQIT